MPLLPSYSKWLLRIALPAIVAITLAPRVAHAQTVALTTGAVVSQQSPGGASYANPNNVDATWISFNACEQNVSVVFPLTMVAPTGGNFSGYNLQAWASSGTDCTDLTQRNATTGTCWKVLTSSITPQLSVTIPIRIQDLVARLGAGSTAGVNPGYPNGTEAACHVVTTSGIVPLNVQFIFFMNNSNAVNSAQFGFNVEMIGPAPPTGLVAGIGDGLLKLTWTPVSDPTTQGFQIFVDPLPGHEDGGLEDASTAATPPPLQTVCADAGFADGGLDDAGLPVLIPLDGGNCRTTTIFDAESPAATTCPSHLLVTGVTSETSSTTTPTVVDDSGIVSDSGATITVTGTAPTPAELVHSFAAVGGGTSTSYTLKGLKNGINYTVALAAVDNLNDFGPLSIPTCNPPGPIDDFWDVYRADGGQSGGAFCALEGVGVPTGAGIFGLSMASALVAWVRRRRRS